MENQDFSFDQSPSEEEPLTLPHFDDEATVQSARPVVPLHEVKRAALTRRHFLLGAALCLAAVVGAVIASLIYSQPAQRAPEATATISDSTATSSDDFVTPSGEASGSTVNPDDAAALNAETADEKDAGSERTVTKVVSSNRQPASRAPRVEKRPEQAVSEPEIQDPGELDLRAEEQRLREQRREARRARRQRRASDGLTRIREIFEGSPRP